MNKWNIVWNTYMRECKRIQILKDIFNSGSRELKFSILVIFMFFLVSVGITVYVGTYNIDILGMRFAWVFIFMFFEMILVILFDKIKSAYIDSRYNARDLTYSTPESKDLQVIRFLKFRFQLKEKNISEEDIESLLEILAEREDIEIYRNSLKNKYLAFLAGTIITLLLILLEQQSGIKAVILVIISIIGLGVIPYILISVVPRMIERMKELKYFLTIFKHEKVLSPDLEEMSDELPPTTEC